MSTEEPYLSQRLRDQGWITARSRSTGKWYFFNTRTNTAMYEPPEDENLHARSSNDDGNQSPGVAYGAAFSHQEEPRGSTEDDAEDRAPFTTEGEENNSFFKPDNSAAVRAKYDRLEQQTQQEREQSEIYNLRNFNNWIKSVLIQEYTSSPCNRVLDLACGKFGDLRKWVAAGILKYVGIDIASEQVVDATGRYNDHISKLTSQAQQKRQNQLHDEFFVAKFAVADLGTTDLNSTGLFDDHNTKSTNSSISRKETFHAISMQFALHYLFESDMKALRFFQNIQGRLAEDGVFIGTIPDANVLIRKIRNLPEGCYEFGNSLYRVKFTAESKTRQWYLDSNPFGVKYVFSLEVSVVFVR